MIERVSKKLRPFSNLVALQNMVRQRKDVMICIIITFVDIQATNTVS